MKTNNHNYSDNQEVMTSDQFRADAVEKGLLTTDWKHATRNFKLTGEDMYQLYLRKVDKRHWPKKPSHGDPGPIPESIKDMAWGIWGNWATYVDYIESKKIFFKRKAKGEI